MARSARIALWAGLLGSMILVHARPAQAQSVHVRSAAVEACSLRAVVRTTVLGITTEVPLPCTSRASRTAPGAERGAPLDVLTLGVAALAGVAGVTGPFSASSWVDTPQRTQLTAETGTLGLSLAQGGVQLSNLAGRLTCQSVSGGDVVSCAAATTVAAITVAGQPVAIPAQPIPVNHVIPVPGLGLGVNLLGLSLSIPVSGQLVLNRVTVRKTGTQFAFDHAPMALTLGGAVQLLGLGLIGVELEMLDTASIQVTTGSEGG